MGGEDEDVASEQRCGAARAVLLLHRVVGFQDVAGGGRGRGGGAAVCFAWTDVVCQEGVELVLFAWLGADNHPLEVFGVL